MAYQLGKKETELREQFEDSRIQFLLIELDTAATFCDVALTSSDPEKTQRNIENARLGHETAMRLARKAQFDPRSRAEFKHRLAHLKSLLVQLGQAV